MSKGRVCTYLNSIADILRREKICIDTTPLKNVAGELGKSDDWTYNLQKLAFRTKDIPRNTRPNNINSLDVILSVQITETKHIKHIEKHIQNPIIGEYNFSIEISSIVDNNKVVSYWHLDFDNSQQDYSYIHPYFHLTYGGNKMKSMNIGDVLLLPSPRISHPPMDAILGIDFVIRNFFKKEKCERIISDSLYREAVKSSQRRLWRPYILAAANHWCGFQCACYIEKSDEALSRKYFPSLES